MTEVREDAAAEAGDAGGPDAAGEGVAERRGERGALDLWLHAARPHTLPAAAAPVLAGGGLALADDAFAPLPFAAALAGAGLLQIGANVANDYFDGVRGADDEKRGGFVRVTGSSLVAPERVRGWMVATFALAMVPGGYLAWVGGWPVVAVGLAGIVAAVAYTGGPWPYGYRGLGELFVFVFFGLVAVAGTHYVQSLAFSVGALLAGAGVGAHCAAILVVNNLRDRETDARAGKRTLAVRLGVGATRSLYVALLAAAATVPVAGVAALGWSPGALLAWIAVAAAVPAARTVLRDDDPEALDDALTITARTLGLYGLLLGVGVNL